MQQKCGHQFVFFRLLFTRFSSDILKHIFRCIIFSPAVYSFELKNLPAMFFFRVACARLLNARCLALMPF